MKKSLFLMIALCSAMCFAACDDDDKPKSFLDCDSTYKPRCSDDSTTWLYCGTNGRIAQKDCESGYCDKVQNKCTVKPAVKPDCDATYGQKCLASGQGYSFCDAGKIKERPCTYGCEAATGQCKPAPLDDACKDFAVSCTNDTHYYACDSTGIKQKHCNYGCDPDKNQCFDCDNTTGNLCTTPHVLSSCRDGYFVDEICKNGQMCNSELKTQECRTPKVGDACDPDFFAEFCYGTTKLHYCDAETGKVDAYDCEEDYGQGYSCDIIPDYYDVDFDVASCIAEEDECEDLEDIYIDCEHEDDETGYRHFYAVMYECGEFTSGNYWYYVDDYECKNKCTDEEPECEPLDDEDE